MEDSPILVERWYSEDRTAAEVHVFLKDDQRGYAYIIGYNPTIFSKENVMEFLAKHNIELVIPDPKPIVENKEENVQG